MSVTDGNQASEAIASGSPRVEQARRHLDAAINKQVSTAVTQTLISVDGGEPNLDEIRELLANREACLDALIEAVVLDCQCGEQTTDQGADREDDEVSTDGYCWKCGGIALMGADYCAEHEFEQKPEVGRVPVVEEEKEKLLRVTDQPQLRASEADQRGDDRGDPIRGRKK